MKNTIIILIFFLICTKETYSFENKTGSVFLCKDEIGSTRIEILKKFNENFLILQSVIKDNKWVNFASFTGNAIEYVSVEKEFLTMVMISNMLSDDEKLTYYTVVFQLKPEQISKTKINKKSKYDKLLEQIQDYELKELSFEELENEIMIHNVKVDLLGELLTKKNIEAQAIVSRTMNCNTVIDLRKAN